MDVIFFFFWKKWNNIHMFLGFFSLRSNEWVKKKIWKTKKKKVFEWNGICSGKWYWFEDLQNTDDAKCCSFCFQRMKWSNKKLNTNYISKWKITTGNIEHLVQMMSAVDKTEIKQNKTKTLKQFEIRKKTRSRIFQNEQQGL